MQRYFTFNFSRRILNGLTQGWKEKSMDKVFCVTMMKAFKKSFKVHRFILLYWPQVTILSCSDWKATLQYYFCTKQKEDTISNFFYVFSLISSCLL